MKKIILMLSLLNFTAVSIMAQDEKEEKGFKKKIFLQEAAYHLPFITVRF